MMSTPIKKAVHKQKRFLSVKYVTALVFCLSLLGCYSRSDGGEQSSLLADIH